MALVTALRLPLTGLLAKRPVARLALVVGALLVVFTVFPGVLPRSHLALFTLDKPAARQHKLVSVPPQQRKGLGKVYSTHNCVGPSREGPELDGNRCHFQNVCLELDNILRAPQEYPQHNNFQRSSVSLTYFRPPAARDTPHYWNDEHRWIEPWARIGRDSYLTPEVVYAPIPENSRWSDAETAVLQEAFWPENFGHSMGDDFLPVFRLARSFGLWSRSDLQVIMHPPCSDRGHPTRGCAHHAELSNLLLARPLEDYNTSLFNAPPPFEGRACFRNLLVGTRRLGMGFPSEHVWPEFVRELRVGAGLDPLARPKRQRVVLLQKVGRRTVRNYDEVEDALRKRFEVDVEVVNPEELSLVEQLERMQQTTVVVSPCGGVSFSAMFLPAGSSAVFIDYWDARWNTTAQMERFIYTYNDNVMPFYYPVEKRDLHLDRSKLPNWVNQKDEYEVWRNWPDVTVNVERMERYVFSALLHAEVSYGWHDSFRMESPAPLT